LGKNEELVSGKFLMGFLAGNFQELFLEINFLDEEVMPCLNL